MTIEHERHAVCESCPTSPAMCTVTEPWFDQWETIEMEHGEDAHLCPACQQKRHSGWLPVDFVRECQRCGRNTRDNPEVTGWRGMPTGDRRSIPPLNKQWVCEDCQEDGESFLI